jgi:hypothetical protein
MARKKFSELRSIRELRNRKKPTEGKGWTKNALGGQSSEVSEDKRGHVDSESR